MSLLFKDNTGAEWVWKPLLGRPPYVFAPPIALPLADIRDVVRVHILAMITPGAAGRRFVISPMTSSFAEIFRILADEFNGQGYSVSRTVLPQWALYAASFFNRDALQGYKNSLVAAPRCSHAELTSALGILETELHTDVASLVRQTAYSCIRFGIAEDRSPGKALSLSGLPVSSSWLPQAAVAGLAQATILPPRA